MNTLAREGQSQLPGLLGKLGKMTSIRDTELLEQSLLRTLGPMLGVLDTALYRSDERNSLVRVIFHHCSKTTDGNGVARMVESVEEVVNLHEVPADIHSITENVRLLLRPCTRKQGIKFLVAYPLFGANEVRGYFVFSRDREVTAVEDISIRGVLEVFSNYYALLDVSQRDRLTGLLNRQALESSFDRIWSALRSADTVREPGHGRARSVDNYWLAVMDLDHFKKVNDQHGHMVGDEVLLLAARLLVQSFRSSDLIYRYGGEEFVAIVAAENEEMAIQIFDRARRTMESFLFPRVDHMTISIGFCRAEPNMLPQDVLGRADKSLYEAKNRGRNRICSYATLLAEGVFQETTYGDAELF